MVHDLVRSWSDLGTLWSGQIMHGQTWEVHDLVWLKARPGKFISGLVCQVSRTQPFLHITDAGHPFAALLIHVFTVLKPEPFSVMTLRSLLVLC